MQSTVVSLSLHLACSFVCISPSFTQSLFLDFISPFSIPSIVHSSTMPFAFSFIIRRVSPFFLLFWHDSLKCTWSFLLFFHSASSFWLTSAFLSFPKQNSLLSSFELLCRLLLFDMTDKYMRNWHKICKLWHDWSVPWLQTTKTSANLILELVDKSDIIMCNLLQKTPPAFGEKLPPFPLFSEWGLVNACTFSCTELWREVTCNCAVFFLLTSHLPPLESPWTMNGFQILKPHFQSGGNNRVGLCGVFACLQVARELTACVSRTFSQLWI